MTIAKRHDGINLQVRKAGAEERCILLQKRFRMRDSCISRGNIHRFFNSAVEIREGSNG